MRIVVSLILFMLLPFPAQPKTTNGGDCKLDGDLIFKSMEGKLSPDETKRMEEYQQCARKLRQDGPTWAGDMMGQYFCYTNAAVGLFEGSKSQMMAGSTTIPETDKKFFMTLEKYDRSQVSNLCSQDLQTYSKKILSNAPFESPDGASINNRSWIAQLCLSKWKLILRKPQSKIYDDSYYAYDLPESFAGYIPELWFRVSKDNGGMSFVASVIGDILEFGRCEKIQPPK